MQTNVDEFKKSAEPGNFNSKHVLYLTRKDVDWCAKCKRTCQRFWQVDRHKTKLEHTHCNLHMNAPVSHVMTIRHTHTHTHTHTHPFNGPFSGTSHVRRYQKGKTNLDFTEARDSEWQWHQLGHMQVCISLQRQPCQHPTTQVFYRPDALPAAQPTASKHWRHIITIITHTHPFNNISGSLTFQESKLHVINHNLLPDSVLKNPFYHLSRWHVECGWRCWCSCGGQN